MKNNLWLAVAFLFLILSSCSPDSVKNISFDPATSVGIPIGGNSYITSGKEGKVEETGFSSWSSTETTLSTFFRVNTEGDLKLFLQYNTDVDGNEIEATYKDQTFKVKLPKTEEGSDSILYIGEIAKCAIGYARIDLKGVVLKGTTFAKPSYLFVSGEASKDMNFVGDFSYYWGRRGPSVHMNYPIPEGVTAEWFYNEITVPEEQDPIGSYFMSNGFGEGYFGMQVNSETERRVLFSVWSPFKTDDPKEIPESHQIKLVKKGADVHTGEFGNEGSGGQSYLKYNWVAGQTYSFLTHIRPSDKGYSEYTSYFYAPEVGEWKLIAQFLRPNTTTYYTRPHSFLENFHTETGYVGRMAHYNNQWIYTKEGKWIELTQGKFTADETARKQARMDYSGGARSEGFFLQNCGFLDSYATINTEFTRKATGKQPKINWSELK